MDLYAREGWPPPKVERYPQFAAQCTVLMENAKVKFGEVLKRYLTRMHPPRCAVYTASTGKPLQAGTDPAVIVKHLLLGFTSRALWGSTVQAMIQDGVSAFYDIGPGRFL